MIIDSLGNNEQSLIYYDYEMFPKEGMTINQKMEESDLFKLQLSEKWGMDIPDGVLSKIYIPCGKNIFNIKQAIDKQIQKEINIRWLRPA